MLLLKWDDDDDDDVKDKIDDDLCFEFWLFMSL